MSYRMLLTVAGLLALVFGAGFLFMPGLVLSYYGVTTNPSGLWMAQFFGAALVHLALLVLLLRKVQDPAIQRGVGLASTLGTVASLLVAIVGQVGHLVNGLGWSTIAIYGLLLLGYARLAFGRPRAT
jgi:hypothetical protein